MSHDNHHLHAPLMNKTPFFSSGTLVLLAVMAIGYSFGLARMLTGIGPITNLNDQYPWGIWIAIDVASGVALAAGGFTTAALVNIFGRGRYHALERPALLTAWLGYTFVGIGLMFDLGRYYNIWHPAIYWQGNSALFEVGMCVMFYLNVLTIEFAPTILTGLLHHMGEEHFLAPFLRKLEKPVRILRFFVNRIMPVFVIAGVVLSFMHQSSLGTLMLIAPTKSSPLWWTPILPILFLLSAIAVGFPMVIFEGIVAAKSFGRKLEMELFTPLSRIIPFTLGLYAIVKFSDLLIRQDLSIFLNDAGQTTAFLVEIGVGIVIPFVMLLQKSVRRSPRWLFIAVSLIIAGVVINRINVFLVSYQPLYADGGYFPSIGEIAVTAGLIATIMFIYRFFAVFFPVMPIEEDEILDERMARQAKFAPAWAWVARGLAVIVVLGFIGIYAAVHFSAIKETQQIFNWFKAKPTLIESQSEASERMQPLTFTRSAMPDVLTLNHSFTNEKINDYEPVRFMHHAHATHTEGNCTVCHHRIQTGPNDRVGKEIGYADMRSEHPVSCAQCHQRAGEDDYPARPGLKGAFHMQCMGCHEKSASKNAPTDCISCHHPHVPDHSTFIDFVGIPKPQQLTERCLDCHERSANDVLDSMHWNWTGLSPYTEGHEKSTTLGKANIPNNFCIHIASNQERCAQCHVGYGWVDDSFDFSDPSNIDCLVCHDTLGTYEKSPSNGGLPMDGVNTVQVAQNVGRPTRESCGSCHFYGGGGANVKHGDLEPLLTDPPDDFDVHMGRQNMLCQDCHTTKNHKIAGRSLASPATEGKTTCEQCHGDNPHSLNPTLGVHLDKHTRSISCQLCHIPYVAKDTPTKVFWDWSKAGQDLPVEKDDYGMPTFDKKKGSFKWAKDLKPCVMWYNGKRTNHLLGDKVDPDKPTMLNHPSGSFEDMTAKLTPFKCYTGIIPYDAKNKTLVVPNLWKGFWKHYDWSKAVEDGMKAVDMPFSGELGWTEGKMFWALSHEVVPADKALGCADCHSRQAATCTRCHGSDDLFTPELFDARYPDRGKQVDFEALGYPGDPALTGERGQTAPNPGNAPLRH